MYYYYGYHILLYDLPIFILFFGVTFLILKMFLNRADPVFNTAIAAVSASLAYIAIRENFYTWFIMHRMTVFGVLLGVILLAFAFFALKYL